MKLKNIRVPVILFLISLLLNTGGIWWGLPNYYTWSVDDLTPLHPLELAKNFLKADSLYPIFHFVLSDIFYAPYLLYLYLTGGLVSPSEVFPYGFTDPLASLTVLMLISRFISAVMGAFAVVFIYLSVKTIYGRKAALFSALSIAFCNIIILYAHLGNLDAPYLFWFTLAIYAYVKLLKTYEIKYYVLLGIFTATAVSTKDQIIGFFVLLPFPLLYLHLRHHLKQTDLKTAIFNKKLFYCLLALILTFLLINNILINFSGFKHRVDFFLSKSTFEKNAQVIGFPTTLLGEVQLFQGTLLKLKDSVGIALFLLLITGFFYCLYNFDDYTFAFLPPLISYYMINIVGISLLHYRYVIPFIIILSFFAGKFLSDMVENVNAKKFIYPLVLLVFLHAFLCGLSADLSLIYDSRHSAENWMVENINKDAKIEVYHDWKFLPRFHALGFENVDMVFFFWNKTEKPPIILFNPVTYSDPPDLESLKKRNPDYIILPGSVYEELEYLALQEELEKKKVYLKLSEKDKKLTRYIQLLLSEEAGYKIVQIFDNNIPFALEHHFLIKRVNIPVIILEKDIQSKSDVEK